MSYTVTFQEVTGHVSEMGVFPSYEEAMSFVKSNVCYQDLESLGTAHINGQFEQMALYQDNEVLGCYRIA